MEYKKYQHIEKLGTTEVEGILEVQVSLFYKIDSRHLKKNYIKMLNKKEI